MDTTQRQTPTDKVKVIETVKPTQVIKPTEPVKPDEAPTPKVIDEVNGVLTQAAPVQAGLEPVEPSTDDKADIPPVVEDAKKIEAPASVDPAVEDKKADKKKPKVSGKKVEFYSKQALLSVKLDLETTINFVNHKADVPVELVERLLTHHLAQQGHILNSNEAILAGNTVVSLKHDSDAVKEAVNRIKNSRAAKAEQEEFVFVFENEATIVVRLGMDAVNFTKGKAIVSKNFAERLRLHTFFEQGIIKELFVA